MLDVMRNLDFFESNKIVQDENLVTYGKINFS